MNSCFPYPFAVFPIFLSQIVFVPWQKQWAAVSTNALLISDPPHTSWYICDPTGYSMSIITIHGIVNWASLPPTIRSSPPYCPGFFFFFFFFFPSSSRSLAHSSSEKARQWSCNFGPTCKWQKLNYLQFHVCFHNMVIFSFKNFLKISGIYFLYLNIVCWKTR